MKIFFKTIIAFILIVSILPTVFAQKKSKQEEVIIQAPTMPIDKSTDKVTYANVFETKGTAQDLYQRGLLWFNGFYNNPADVIRKKVELEGKIVGKARFNIYGKDANGIKINDGLVQYDITLQCKEGRYKYEITSIIHKQRSVFPIEKWIEENNINYNAQYASYLVQLNDYMQQLIASLQKAMEVVTPAKDNW